MKKLLLTSDGVTNATIRTALVDLLGKPIEECNALCIPTAMYGHPWVGPGVKAWKFIAGQSENPMVALGWKSVGVLELTALPSLPRERWEPTVREADVLLAAGGDAVYLSHWMTQSGLAELMPSLTDTVWVGMSGGSMALTPRIGEWFVGWRASETADDAALGLVDFSIFPHLDNPGLPTNTMENATKWAAMLDNSAYAIDADTAIVVSDGNVNVVSEGHWRLFA